MRLIKIMDNKRRLRACFRLRVGLHFWKMSNNFLKFFEALFRLQLSRKKFSQPGWPLGISVAWRIFFWKVFQHRDDAPPRNKRISITKTCISFDVAFFRPGTYIRGAIQISNRISCDVYSLFTPYMPRSRRDAHNLYTPARRTGNAELSLFSSKEGIYARRKPREIPLGDAYIFLAYFGSILPPWNQSKEFPVEIFAD